MAWCITFIGSKNDPRNFRLVNLDNVDYMIPSKNDTTYIQFISSKALLSAESFDIWTRRLRERKK